MWELVKNKLKKRHKSTKINTTTPIKSLDPLHRASERLELTCRAICLLGAFNNFFNESWPFLRAPRHDANLNAELLLNRRGKTSPDKLGKSGEITIPEDAQVLSPAWKSLRDLTRPTLELEKREKLFLTPYSGGASVLLTCLRISDGLMRASSPTSQASWRPQSFARSSPGRT